MADKTVTFGIRIPVETDADNAAASVEQLRKKLQDSQDAVKGYSASLRNLRGSSDEVKAAKAKLKAAVDAERNAISQATLALGKHGKTALDTSKKLQEAKSKVDAFKSGISSSGGPLSGMMGRLEGLQGLLSGAGGAAGIMALAVGAAVAAFAALAVGVIATGIALAKFAIEGANALRTMALMREAASGSEENAKAWGTQMDALALKIPLTTDKLQALSLGLEKAFRGSRISGEGMVDTFKAVGNTAAAMGDDAGKAIQGILEKGKRTGRFSLGLYELQEAGLGNIKRADVMAQIAKNMHKSVGQVNSELMYGQITLSAGAKALSQITEKQFGKVNAKRMLDLDVLADRLHDKLRNLTKGVDFAPIGEGLDRLLKLFDENTASGQIMKTLLSDFVGGIGKLFTSALPSIEAFFLTFLTEALKMETTLIKLDTWFVKTFGVDLLGGLGDTKTAVLAAKVAFTYLAIAVATVAIPVIAIGAVFYGLIEIIKDTIKWVGKLWKSFEVGGIAGGIVKALGYDLSKISKAGEGMGDAVKDGTAKSLEIHSPSKVYEKFGRMTTAGFEDGVEAGSSGARGAVGSMVAPPPMNIGGGKSTVNLGGVHISVTAGGGANGDDIAKSLSAPNFRAELTKAIIEMLVSAGVPTDQVPA